MSRLQLSLNETINVFISSRCGDCGKYDRVRSALKDSIEDTGLAKVYLFEQTGPSTLPAGCHYEWKLENSDVCIFLIDNGEGISDGVRNEINIARCNEIKSLYYFCDETTDVKTALEESLKGAKYAKSQTIHSFEELSRDGARDLINDILHVYSSYCKGRLVPQPSTLTDDFQETVVSGGENLLRSQIPKSVLQNIDQSKAYIMQMTGISSRNLLNTDSHVSEIDEWGVKLLSVLFEGVSIKNINCSLFLDALCTLQDETYHKLVCMRWKAVQEYFMGDVEKCVLSLEDALKFAKEIQQPAWVIKDILIDLRNQKHTLDVANNYVSLQSIEQDELNESAEAVYYPLLDRLYQSLQEKYVDGFYEQQVKSPSAVTIGNNLDVLAGLLASAFIVIIYNGSLTHLIVFYEKIREFFFYLSHTFNERGFPKNLIKFVIFEGKENRVKAMCDSYPEIFNTMTATDAENIMKFCDNHTIAYKRLSSRLLAFGTVGYYLDDIKFQQYETMIIREITEWIADKHQVVLVGNYIFRSLTGVCYRLSQDSLAQICIQFMERHLSRWYMDMFQFMAQNINLNKMTVENAHTLIAVVMQILDDEEERRWVSCRPMFLCALRLQNRELTNELDAKIKNTLPQFYDDSYRLETTNDKQRDFPVFIQKYIADIDQSNVEQGRNGRYFIRGMNKIGILRSILLDDEFVCPNEELDSIIATLVNTLLMSKESTGTKLDAISLLLCISIKFPQTFKNSIHLVHGIVEQKNEICKFDNTIMDANIDMIALNIGLCFLQMEMGEDIYTELLGNMSFIQDDTATIIAVEKTISQYLEVSDKLVLPERVDALILQYSLQWVAFNHVDVRWLAIQILFHLLRNPQNHDIINQKIICMIDSDGVYIKNFIQRNVNIVQGVDQKTREYVASKCKCDENYVVRMICAEEE